MITISKEKWDSIYSDYKGTWQDYYDEHPEWIGRKVVMSGCICNEHGKLYVEGVHFVIEGMDVPDNGLAKDNETFSKEELSLAEKLSYENANNEDSEIGFDFNGTWITNPFMDETARFEFKTFTDMQFHYGKENVNTFITSILQRNS